MDIGIYVDLRNPPSWSRPWVDHYARTLELIEEAERLGAATVWLSEHHFFEDGYLTQPLTFAAAVAARTRAIRLGTAVLLAPLRPALQIAEDAALVDLLSGGRLDLGVGVGYRVPEYSAFGVDIGRRYVLVEETIREVRRLLDGVVTPPPVQQPIPMWGGFFGPRGASLAGRLGMGLLALSPSLFEQYRAGLHEGGHDVGKARIKAALSFVVADDPDAAWARIRPHFAYQQDSYRRYMVEGTGTPPPRPIDPDAWRVPRAAGERAAFSVVTPPEAISLITSATEGLPVEEIFCWASIAGMPDDLVERHVSLLCSVVAPGVAGL